MMKCFKTRRVYKPANNNGILGSVALFDIITSPEYEKLVKMSYRDLDNLGTPDPILTALIEEKGFDALPVVVDNKHYDLLLRSKLKEIYRGVRRPNAAKEFAYDPKMFVGKGIYCNGIYFTYGGEGAKAEAELYLYPQSGEQLKLHHGYMKTYPKGEVICALMKKDTKVADVKDLCKLKQRMENYVNKQIYSDSTKQKIINMISRDLAVVAVLHGYDAIDIKNSKYMVVLNRGKLIMKDPNLKDNVRAR